MRILMRASQSPFDNISPFETILYDKIWSNVGNLLFPFSLFKILISEDTTIDIYSSLPKSSDAEYINANYDMLLLPFANAFRQAFEKQLVLWTELIEKIQIPCVVVGIGAQAGLDFNSNTSFVFDASAKRFCNAVASKSAYIGVRGELTYEYLKRLGYGSVTKVIGCPSMYMYGANLPEPKQKKDGELVVSVNSKNSDSEKIKEFLFRNNSCRYFVPQETYEFKISYCGMPAIHAERTNNIYPLSIDNDLFYKDKVRFCVNVPSWLKLLNTVDLSIGSRIHGNIAAVLAGVPAFIIATDSRILELARFHNIPYTESNAFDFSKSFRAVYDETDFTTVNKNHENNYYNFVKFLEANGLSPIIQPNAFFDKKVEEIDYYPAVTNLLQVSEEEQAQRLNDFYGHLLRKIDKLTKKLNTK
ncbi:MAG: polysaccharide pyruvyl transferase family protein [Ruminiclostridium sp.]|nr:polysaccharide pyruvyl transferase family protein [Ruminiclostridium sp.]